MAYPSETTTDERKKLTPFSLTVREPLARGWLIAPGARGTGPDDWQRQQAEAVLGWRRTRGRPISARRGNGAAKEDPGSEPGMMRRFSNNLCGHKIGEGVPSDLSDCLACALLIFDDEKRITGFSPETEQLINVRSDRLTDGTLQSLPAPLQKVIEETFATGKPIHDRRITLPSGEAEALVLSVTTSLPASPDKNGKGHGVITVLNDLTFAKKLEANLRRLDRLASIGTFSASMAHEIKNALVAVKTFFELLPKSNQSAELAEIVTREITRIDSIVSQMLKFASPAKPVLSPLRLHEILEHSLRLIEHQLDRKRIKVSLRFAASPDTVKGDDYQLEQAFFNLFFNAMEAMEPNGRLTVATKIIRVRPGFSTKTGKLQRHLLVTVKDTGVGISAQNLSRLFEPFFTTKPNGTGLGLSITRRIIQEHGGWITVNSAMNKGTTFDILFPLLKRGARGRESPD